MSQHLYWAGMVTAVALVLGAPGESRSQNPSQEGEPPDQQVLIGPVLPGKETHAPDGKSDAANILNWETGAGRSYVIPAVEILAYLLLLNQFDRHYTDPPISTAQTAIRFGST